MDVHFRNCKITLNKCFIQALYENGLIILVSLYNSA